MNLQEIRWCNEVSCAQVELLSVYGAVEEVCRLLVGDSSVDAVQVLNGNRVEVEDLMHFAFRRLSGARDRLVAVIGELEAAEVAESPDVDVDPVGALTDGSDDAPGVDSSRSAAE